MEAEKPIKRKKSWAIILGLGLALSPIHNLWLTQFATSHGEVNFFIPQFGTLLWLFASLAFIVWNWEAIDFGNIKILILLSIIALSIGISGMVNGHTLGDRISPFFMGLSLVAVYVTCRTLGDMVFKVLMPFVLLDIIIVVIIGLLIPGLSQGGLITNNCASAGYIIFGTVAVRGKWQWLLCAIAYVGLFYIGELEPVFMMCIIIPFVLLRRDYSVKAPLSLIPVTIAIIASTVTGHIVELYWGNGNVVEAAHVAMGEAPVSLETADAITSDRVNVYLRALQDLKIVGHGYSLSTTNGGVVHNMPLIIADQVGVPAAFAWLIVTVYCFFKTRWKYAWLCVIAMSVFDHYLWTQLTPYWWALVGISTASTIKSDYIYKEVS